MSGNVQSDTGTLYAASRDTSAYKDTGKNLKKVLQTTLSFNTQKIKISLNCNMLNKLGSIRKRGILRSGELVLVG